MEAAPFSQGLAEGPEGGQAVWLRASDGVQIRAVYWPCKGAKGTVLIFPGRTEYAEKYGRAAAEFGARGFAVVVIDWRGQGLSDRLTPDRALGYVERFTDYQKDIDALLSALPHWGAPQPCFLVAHSMGGAIGLRGLNRGLPVQAATFSGPMWGIELSLLVRPVAWGLTELARAFGRGQAYAPGTQAQTYVMSTDFEDNTLTRDRDYFDYMRGQLADQPDLALGGPSMHWLNEALHEMAKLRAHPLPDLPVQVHVGSNERIVSQSAIRQVNQRWRQSTLYRYAGAEHELMMEVPEVRGVFFDRSAALFVGTLG